MNLNKIVLVFEVFFVFVILINSVYALSVSVTQSGADADEVMKGRTFIVEASGWTGDCSQATISFSGCSSCGLSGENTQKTIGGGATSVSWTTVSATQLATAQTISVSVSGGCTLQQATSDSFDIVLPPSLSVEATPSTSSVVAGNTFDVNLNIVNSGETTANDVTTSVDPSVMSISSGCSPISSIDEGQSAGQSCTILASTAGTYTVTFTVSSTNADSASDSFSMTVTSAGGGQPPGGPGGVPGGGTAGPSEEKAKNATRKPTLVPGVGLRNNTKLQQAIEKVLGKGRLNENAIENLIRLSNSITSQVQVTREFETKDGKSELTTKMTYKGGERVKNFMVYEKVPKTFSTNAKNITVTAYNAKIEVVEEDPEYMFLYSEMEPNQEVVIKYSINQEVDTSMIDEAETFVYGESYEGLAPGEICIAGEKRCSGNDLQQCKDDGTGWTNIETCEYGCDSKTLSCKQPSPEEAPPVEFPAWVWIPVIIAIVVIIAAAFLFHKKGHHHKVKLPKPLPQMKTPPSSMQNKPSENNNNHV